STQSEALRLLARLRNDERFEVLDSPGPFNFSKLCNEGARRSHARLLVFLNNDIEICDADWLEALVRTAMKPGVGVVGAMLLFPHDAIQHAGIVLGMGGIAGHI